MLESSRNFIDKCKKGIKDNNKKIRDLYCKANECEAIMGVIVRTDINGQMIDAYQQKLNNYLNKIDRLMEDNKNNHDLINIMKQANKIIKNNR